MGWEERYQIGDTPWDKGAAAPPLIDLLRSNPDVFGDGTVLVPGCGRGHDCREIASFTNAKEVIGIDVSETALVEARSLDTYGNVSYVQLDFLNAPTERFPNVSAVFEHTCFCAIDPSLRPSYASACARLIPSGGYWVAIIFLTPREEDDPTIVRAELYARGLLCA